MSRAAVQYGCGHGEANFVEVLADSRAAAVLDGSEPGVVQVGLAVRATTNDDFLPGRWSDALCRWPPAGPW